MSPRCIKVDGEKPKKEVATMQVTKENGRRQGAGEKGIRQTGKLLQGLTGLVRGEMFRKMHDEENFKRHRASREGKDKHGGMMYGPVTNTPITNGNLPFTCRIWKMKKRESF